MVLFEFLSQNKLVKIMRLSFAELVEIVDEKACRAVVGYARNGTVFFDSRQSVRHAGVGVQPARLLGLDELHYRLSLSSGKSLSPERYHCRNVGCQSSLLPGHLEFVEGDLRA